MNYTLRVDIRNDRYEIIVKHKYADISDERVIQILRNTCVNLGSEYCTWCTISSSQSDYTLQSGCIFACHFDEFMARFKYEVFMINNIQNGFDAKHQYYDMIMHLKRTLTADNNNDYIMQEDLDKFLIGHKIDTPSAIAEFMLCAKIHGMQGRFGLKEPRRYYFKGN